MGLEEKLPSGILLTTVEKVAGEPGEIVAFGEVLMLGGESPVVGSPTIVGASVAGEVLQQLLDLAILFALAVGPFADHLLLGAHMRDEALYRLGEIGHRGRGGAAGTAIFQRRPQPIDGSLKIA